MRTDRARSGYVLLTVIAVCVLMVTLLSVLANRSLSRGLEAADAQRSLQQRWGAQTLERALMAQAPKLFEERAELAQARNPSQPPEPYYRAAITLGGVTFDVLLGDEDAKVDLNALYHYAGQAQTNRCLGDLLDFGSNRCVRLRPAIEPRMDSRSSLTSDEELEAEMDPPKAFRSWGEVFELPMLTSTYGSTAALPNATTGMTCWGSGQLNFQRASDQAILAVAGAVIQDGAARDLLDRYRRSPTATLPMLLQAEVSDREDRETLARLMSQSSTSFSVWIDASTQGRKSLRRFSVQSRDREGDIRSARFEF
ncbi:MAG: hypothetical protein AAGI63_07545 [Planctomycetota bacterium]